jgi:hypothetical protein
VFGNQKGKGVKKMKKICLSNLQYLVLAVLVMAMTGCGANNAGHATNAAADAGVSAKLVWGQGGAAKGTAKTTASVTVPANVASVQFTVTGSGTSGALPVVRSTVSTTGGTVNGIYPGTVVVAALAMDSTGKVVYEGYALNVGVTAGSTTTLPSAIVMSPPLVKAQDSGCVQCHETTLDRTGQDIVAQFKQSGHYSNQSWYSSARFGVVGTGCAGCHGPSHNDVNPATSGRCAQCHVPTVNGAHHSGTYLPVSGGSTSCATCHNSHNPFGPFLGGDCLTCHAFAQDKTANGNYVDDNNGVRVIAGANGEFGANPVKKSHHVVNTNGGDPTAAQCAVCHLEGQVVNGVVTINTAAHMADGKIHLRDGGGIDFTTVDTHVAKATTVGGKSQFAWDPANPDHQLMDQFCFSCHNANGAPNALAAIGTTVLAGQTAKNPFGDRISNGYDQMSRGAVVDAFTAFAPGNVAHHAVRAQKYTTRTRTATGVASIWNQYSSATNVGSRNTLYAAGAFVATYTPLGAVASVGDDSTLHCGDCHTVGQWKPASTTNALGTPTTVAIGAHGSQNEYLLRNAYGTDALHHQGGYNGSTKGVVSAAGGNYVCYLCHNITKYNGADGTHNGIDETSRCNGQETVGLVGVNNTTIGVGTGLTAGQTANTLRISGIGSSGGMGNLFGYSCAYCHASGNQGFGGIHGSNAVFTSYSGITGIKTDPISRKPYRFMGGLSLRYNGGNNAEVSGSWERKTLTSASREGCYNLTTAADRNTVAGTNYVYIWGTSTVANGPLTSLVQDDGTINGSWGACGHHTGATTGGNATAPNRKIQRPLSY